MSRLIRWCLGEVAISYERGTPVCLEGLLASNRVTLRVKYRVLPETFQL